MEIQKSKLLEAIAAHRNTPTPPINGEMTGESLSKAIIEARATKDKEAPVLGTGIYTLGAQRKGKVPRRTEEWVKEPGASDSTEEPQTSTPDATKPEVEVKPNQEPKEETKPTPSPEVKPEEPKPKVEVPPTEPKTAEPDPSVPSLNTIEKQNTNGFVGMALFTKAEKKALLASPENLWHRAFNTNIIVDLGDFLEAGRAQDGEAIVRGIDATKQKLDIPFKYLDRLYSKGGHLTLRLNNTDVDFLEMVPSHPEGVQFLAMGEDVVVRYLEGNTWFYDRGIPEDLLSDDVTPSVLPAVADLRAKEVKEVVVPKKAPTASKAAKAPKVKGEAKPRTRKTAPKDKSKGKS